jgi:hypothetical protein
MKILLINKFLYPNGGSETYIFKLGQQLTDMGHEVQYFGMEHEGRIVGNRVEAYTSDMDFHGGSKLAKLTYPIKTIYSSEARKKLRLVLEDFRPDVCHLNNFNYQLTPSIILEIRKWSKDCKILYTAHDLQLVEIDFNLSEKWTRLRKWYMFAFLTYCVSLMIIILLPTVGAVISIAASFAMIIINALKIYYLYRSYKVFEAV